VPGIGGSHPVHDNVFTLLFEALIIILCREMPFAAVARLVKASWLSIDMSPAVIEGVAEQLRPARKRAPMNDVARLIRNHMEGIVAWVQTRQTTGFLEAWNGLIRPPSATRAATAGSRPSAR
jgi:hypothetical protein